MPGLSELLPMLGLLLAGSSVAGFLLMRVNGPQPHTIGAVFLPAVAVFLAVVALNMLRKAIGW